MSIYQKIAELEKNNQVFAVATVIDAKGSVPGKVCFKMVVTNTETFGTVGGGAIELEAISEARNLMQLGENRFVKYILSKGNVKAESDEKVIPMMCNGKVSIFYETYGQKPTAYIFGGGHVGQSLLNIIPNLGYQSILVDNREEYANAVKCPGADKYHHSDYEKFVEETEFEENSYLVILTHGHSFDYKILEILYKRNVDVKYIGAIASKAKSAEFKKGLKEEFGEGVDLSKLHSPIGLKIGGSTADEIALSIAAEMQSVRYNKY